MQTFTFQKACEEFMFLFLIDIAFSSSSLHAVSVREFRETRMSSIFASIFAILVEISSGTRFFCRFKTTIVAVKIPCGDYLSFIFTKRYLGFS